MLKKQYQNGKGTCKVTFVLPQGSIQPELTGAVKVLGDFNNWNWENGLELAKSGDAFEGSLELQTGRDYQYRYLVENGPWINDPAADRYMSSGFYGIDNSVLELPAQIIEKAKPEAVSTDSVAAPAPAPAKKKTKSTKRAKKDNIKKHIEGIGPKIEKLLAERGITTFKGLATAKMELLKEILAEAGPRFRMHDPATWSEQAQLAADEKWEELETLKVELKGGKRV